MTLAQPGHYTAHVHTTLSFIVRQDKSEIGLFLTFSKILLCQGDCLDLSKQKIVIFTTF